jgi:hypothetical protein
VAGFALTVKIITFLSTSKFVSLLCFRELSAFQLEEYLLMTASFMRELMLE